MKLSIPRFQWQYFFWISFAFLKDFFHVQILKNRLYGGYKIWSSDFEDFPRNLCLQIPMVKIKFVVCMGHPCIQTDGWTDIDSFSHLFLVLSIVGSTTWKNRWHKCILSHGDYFERDKINIHE